MPSFNTLLGATALAAVAIANPVPAADVSLKNFVINESVVKAPKAAVVYLADTYAKYNKPAPKDVSTAAAGSGSVVATPEPYDSEYLCPVTLGGQTLNLDFDTGSADLWVFSSELSSANQAGHSIYNPAKSSTSKKLSGYTWKISYGDGSGASGDVYTDNVSVGGVTVTGQAVECASQISSQFQQDTDNDGLLGLAFSTINTVSPKAQTTFFDTAVNEGKLTSSLFTVDLKKGKPGSYGFGAIDSTKYTGSIAYTPVDSSQGFWSFSTTGYGVGSKYTTKSSSGIADTGTTLILVDDSTVSAYYAAVSGAKYDSNQGGYTFACSATLPSFTVGIGSNKYVVPGSYINFAPIDSTGRTCFGGIQSSSGIGFNIYGDVFLKAVFAVFDKNGPRLGFATKTL